MQFTSFFKLSVWRETHIVLLLQKIRYFILKVCTAIDRRSIARMRELKASDARDPSNGNYRCVVFDAKDTERTAWPHAWQQSPTMVTSSTVTSTGE